MVFRQTNGHRGRHLSVTPENSSSRHLAYGRIILDSATPSVQFATGARETGLICLSGGATIGVDGKPFPLAQFDAIYVPRDSQIEVSTNIRADLAEFTGIRADLAEFSADVECRYPLQFLRHAEISRNPALKSASATPGQARHRQLIFGMNVEAGRLLAGITYSEPANWASWPPHEHTATLEEVYVFFDMPAPAFGLQLLYDDTGYPELVVPVREGDAVLMPRGYHPNVSIPGHKICYLWAMAAHREKVDRKLGMANVQAEFK
jgi:5-deoxy-glucuronate isomerase